MVKNVEVKQPLDKIVPIRLSADKWGELYGRASRLGMGPVELATIWVILALEKSDEEAR